MNKPFFYVLFAALVGLSPAFAAQEMADEATDVTVSLNYKNIGPKPEVTGLASPTVASFGKNPISSVKGDDKSAWHVVNIPIVIHARGRLKEGGKAAARFVRELKVQAYLLFKRPAGDDDKDKSVADRYSLIKKEITYVDIPLVSGKNSDNKEVGVAEMCVGLFIPRMTNYFIVGKNDPERIARSLVGYAVEASFNDAPCNPAYTADKKGENPNGVIFNKKEAKFSGTPWWKERSKDNFVNPGVEVLCISETPFAPFYSPFYPATKPLYGSPDSAHAAASGSAAGSGADDVSGASTGSSSKSSYNY